jgi:hypothetical protein
MERLTLTKPSQPRCTDSPSIQESLISEWVAKLAINAGASLDAKTQAIYKAVWIDGLGDLSPAVLRAAFQKTLRECAYWPVKVADIRKHVINATKNVTHEAAEQAWQRVLEIRRLDWDPDIPSSFERAFSRLTERVRQASRAAGIFREFTAEEYESGALHTWAKKRFLESFHAWGESEQDKFLLPDGETKKLMIEFAETKTLPWPKPKKVPALSAEERLRVADELAAAARRVLGVRKPSVYQVKDTAERREELHRQAELIKARYPQSSGEVHS